MLLIAGVIQTSLYFRRLYDFSVAWDRSALFIRLVEALAISSIALALIYFFLPDLVIGRGVFAIAALLIFAALITWRLLFNVARTRREASGSRLMA